MHDTSGFGAGGSNCNVASPSGESHPRARLIAAGADTPHPVAAYTRVGVELCVCRLPEIVRLHRHLRVADRTHFTGADRDGPALILQHTAYQ